MRIRPIAALASVAALAAFATACEDPGASEDTPAKPPASDQPKEKPEDKEPEKEIDSDRGKTLKLGETTVVSHGTGSESRSAMKITTQTVKQGKLSELEDVRLDGKERQMTPYYVTVNYHYVEGAAPRMSSLGITPKLRDGRGEETDRIFTSKDEVKNCVNNRPEKLAKGEDFTSCRVFLVAKGEQPAMVAYQSDYRQDPVFWKVEQ